MSFDIIRLDILLLFLIFALFCRSISALAEAPAADSCAGLNPTNTCLVNMQPGSPCLGTDGDDDIIGGSENDIIIAGAGKDRVIGGAGNDIICGGAGDDILLADDGDDTLDGGDGNDVLNGAEGEDICISGGVYVNCEKQSETEAEQQNCNAILGKWHWFDNGMVDFTEDKKVQWHEPMTGRKGHSAKWQCDTKSGAVTIPWTNGFTDQMSVISGGSALQGKNNRGMTIWAQRIPSQPSLQTDQGEE